MISMYMLMDTDLGANFCMTHAKVFLVGEPQGQLDEQRVAGHQKRLVINSFVVFC